MKLAAVLGVFGAITLVGLVGLPAVAGESPWIVLAFRRRPMGGAVLLVGALVPIAVACIALATRELLRWQAGLAAAGFALVFVKFRGWDQVGAFGGLATSTRLVVLASMAGTVVAFVGLVRAWRS